MNHIIERLGKLLSVKSLVTMAASAVFAALSLRGTISSREFMSVFIMIIGFYFGTQSQKAQDAPDRPGDAA